MGKVVNGVARGLALAALASGWGCGSDPGPQPGAAEKALAFSAVDGALNSAGPGMQKLLASAGRDGMIYPEELRLPVPEGSIPVDWWLYNHGNLRIAGVNQYMAYFGLTPAGQAFVKAPAPAWLASSPQAAPEWSCSGPRTWVTCRMTATVVVRPTAAGAAVLALPDVAAQAVDLDLEYRPQQGWRVSALRSEAALSKAGATAVFGDAAGINAARNRYAAVVNRLVR